MHLTRYTDYGLRILMYLAVLPEGRRTTVGHLCETFELTRSHATKIVHHLGRAGYLANHRGKGGGVALARTAETVGLGAVVRELETSLEVIDCAEPPCVLRYNCRLKTALDQAMEAYMAVLDDYTLADLVHGMAPLQVIVRQSA